MLRAWHTYLQESHSFLSVPSLLARIWCRNQRVGSNQGLAVVLLVFGFLLIPEMYRMGIVVRDCRRKSRRWWRRSENECGESVACRDQAGRG